MLDFEPKLKLDKDTIRALLKSKDIVRPADLVAALLPELMDEAGNFIHSLMTELDGKVEYCGGIISGAGISLLPPSPKRGRRNKDD